MKICFLILILFLPFISNGQTSTINKKSKRYFDEALIAYYNNNIIEAVEYCEKSIKKDQNFTKPYVLLAQIKSENQNYKQASQYLETVLQIDSNYTQIYYIIGFYY